MADKWFYIMLMVLAIAFFSCLGFLGYCEQQTYDRLIEKYPQVMGHTKKEAGEIIAKIEKEKREALKSPTIQKAN